PYVHYEELRPVFLHEWERFLGLLAKHGVDRPTAAGVEVTYVNQLDRGKGWGGFEDLSSVFAPWSGVGSTGFLPSPNAVAINARYPIADGGSLAIISEPAIRKSDGTSIVQLRLTASIKLPCGGTDAISAAIDRGRNWVVNGFTDFASEAMHKIWKRTI
ncbi:MAG: hypothetical protein ACREFP_19170, partial [Acetobacteraceae bacterium]